MTGNWANFCLTLILVQYKVAKISKLEKLADLPSRHDVVCPLFILSFDARASMNIL